MDGCTIREATLADYSDVMAIGDVYHGFDFLPDMYQDFIQDPDYHCFVLLVEKEIIGFLAAFLIDGGTAFDLRGGRVKENHRGRGYYKALREHIYSFYAKMETVKYEKVVVLNQIGDSLMQPNSGLDFVAVQKINHFDIPNGIGMNMKSELQPLTPNDIAAALSCPRVKNSLFPDGLIYVHRVPFSAEAINLKHLFDKRTITYGTKSNGGGYTLISIGRYFNVRLGFRYWLEVFGTKADDFKMHILAHLTHMRTISCENVSLGIAMNPLFPDDQLREILELGGLPGHRPAQKEYTFQRKL